MVCNLHSDGQAGFRYNHCLPDNILIMGTIIEARQAMKTISQHGGSYACFVDTQEAFDTTPKGHTAGAPVQQGPRANA